MEIAPALLAANYASPECQLHTGDKGPRRPGIDRAGAGRRKHACGVLQARHRADAVGNVVGGSHVGLVEQVLDLEEEDRALEVVVASPRCRSGG